MPEHLESMYPPTDYPAGKFKDKVFTFLKQIIKKMKADKKSIFKFCAEVESNTEECLPLAALMDAD